METLFEIIAIVAPILAYRCFKRAGKDTEIRIGECPCALFCSFANVNERKTWNLKGGRGRDAR